MMRAVLLVAITFGALAGIVAGVLGLASLRVKGLHGASYSTPPASPLSNMGRTSDAPATASSGSADSSLALADARAKAVAADPAKPETQPVTDGSILLTAAAGRIHGFRMKIEKQPLPAIIYWSDPQEYIEWPKGVARKGKYQVEVTYSCAPNAGGEFVIAAGAGKITGRPENTENWQTFRIMQVGTLTVVNAETTLSLRSTGAINHILMNVRSVKLTPM